VVILSPPLENLNPAEPARGGQAGKYYYREITKGQKHEKPMNLFLFSKFRAFVIGFYQLC
jgi:hypothetical protein